jgi:hypothetical protein
MIDFPTFLLGAATLLCGYFAYIAWFKPKQYRRYIYLWSMLYAGWAPRWQARINSDANFWIARVSALLGFIIICIGVIALWLGR